MEALTVIGCCLVINGLLAAYEMAFVSMSKAELRSLNRKGDLRAGTILRFRENPERMLSILQVGITLVAAVAAAVGGVGVADHLRPYFIGRMGLSETAATLVSIGAVVLPLTYLSVVFGELVPKTIALRNPRKIVLAGAFLVTVADRVLHPLISLLEGSTRFILNKLFPIFLQQEDRSNEIIEAGGLSPEHRRYVLNMVNIERKRAKDILLSWGQVQRIDLNDTADRVAQVVLHSGHTRLPVLGEDCKVAGIIHTKEFMALREGGEPHWKNILRPAIEVGPNQSLLGLLRLMQEKRSHMSIVTSPGETPLGIVTLEDIIEEVVGELYDEDDDGRFRKILTAGSAKNRF